MKPNAQSYRRPSGKARVRSDACGSKVCVSNATKSNATKSNATKSNATKSNATKSNATKSNASTFAGMSTWLDSRPIVGRFVHGREPPQMFE